MSIALQVRLSQLEVEVKSMRQILDGLILQISATPSSLSFRQVAGYLFSAFFGFFGFAFWTCGCGAVLSIRRKTSSSLSGDGCLFGFNSLIVKHACA